MDWEALLGPAVPATCLHAVASMAQHLDVDTPRFAGAVGFGDGAARRLDAMLAGVDVHGARL